MRPHLLLLLYIVVCGLIVYHGKRPSYKKNRSFTILSMIGVFFMEAFRGKNVGWDTIRYMLGFIQLNSHVGYGLIAKKWEPLYYRLNEIIRLFTANPRWVLVVTSAIVIIGFSFFIIYNIDEYSSAFWAVFLFITAGHYFNSMNLIRQYCAMAISLNIYTVLRKEQSKKNWIIAIILFVISLGFHDTALLAIGFFVPFIIQIRKRTIIETLLGSIVMLVFFSFVIRLIFKVLPQYSHYSDSVHFNSEGVGVYYSVLIILKLIILVLFFMMKIDESDSDMMRLVFLFTVSIGVLLLKNRVDLAVRTGYYYDIFAVLLIPKLLSRFYRDAKNMILLRSLVVVVGVMMFIMAMRNTARGCVPYYFFWSD